MNRAFRIIWSHARQAFVVTNELASARGKRSGTRMLLAAASAGLLAGALPGAVLASSLCSGGSTTVANSITGNCSIDPGSDLTVSNTGSITNPSGEAVSAGYGFNTIRNSGSITGSTNGITLQAGEVGSYTGTLIENLSGATITGTDNGIVINTDYSVGSLTNAGTIQTGNTIGAGVVLSGATLGSLHNQSGGIIRNTGDGGAVHILDSSITNNFLNDGSISGEGAYAAIYGRDSSIGGNLHNNGSITNEEDGYESAVYLYGFTIDGNLINGANGVIEGGEGAIELNSSIITGNLVNLGTLTGRGNAAAVHLYDSSIGEVRNSGTIQGLNTGLHLDYRSEVNDIVNLAGATIKGGTMGIYLDSNARVNNAISNSGTIQGGEYAIFDSHSSTTLDTIYIDGNNTARFLGDVRADDADVVLKSGAVFANTNAFEVDSFTIQQGATLKMGASTAASNHMANGFTTNEGFFNAGTLSLASAVSSNIYGDYIQADSGTLKIGVASDSSYGKLAVSEYAILESKAKIVVDVSNASYKFNTKSLQDVLSAGTLQSDGTFAVSDNSTLFDFGAIKDGNTVDLTLTATTKPEEPEQPSGTGLVEDIVTDLGNSPAVGAAQVLDQVIASNPTGELAGHFVGLTSEQDVSDAVTSTLPTAAGNASNATSSTLAGINRVVQARQGENSGLSSGDAPLAEDNLWIKTFGSWADQDERSGISGYDADTQGLAIGADAAVSDNTRLGLAFAYAQTNLDNDSRIAPQDAQIDTFQLIGYGSYALTENTELNFQLDGGQNQTEGKRHMPFADATAKSDYDGYNVHAGVGIGHSLRLSEQLTFVPSARADYTWIGTESYHEKGAGALDLDVDSNDAEELLLSLDGKLDYRIADSTVLSANLGGGYDVIDEDSSITSTYSGAPGAAFKTPGMDMEPWLARAGLGLTHTLANGTEVGLRYDAEARSDFTNQGASLKARWAF